jgi:hypothetical protein
MAVQLGDVFDKPRPRIELEKLVVQWVNEFERSGIPLYILTGNHDVIAKPGVRSALDLVKAMRTKFVRVVDRPMVLGRTKGDPGNGGLTYFFLPFPSPSIYENQQQWLDEVRVEFATIQRNRTVVVFAHLNVPGANLGEQEWIYRGGDYDIPEFIFDFPRVSVYNGHIHKQQSLRKGQIQMIGAAQRLRFSERSNTTSFALISGSKLRLKDYPGIDMVQIDVDASGISHADTPPTTAEVVEQIGYVKGAIVKIVPFVDAQTVCDWAEVEAACYRGGAFCVNVAPAVQIRKEKKQPKKRKAVVEPQEAAKAFIIDKLSDKGERKAVYRKFKKLQRTAEGAA